MFKKMMRKYYEEKESDGAKKYIVPLLCAVAAVVVLGGLFYLKGRQDKKKEANTEAVTETESETGSLTSQMQEALATEQETFVSIDNLNEYVSVLESEKQQQFLESLTNFVKEEGIAAESGTIFYTMVPENDQESVSYFVSLGGEPEVICQLSYHTREKIVTASKSTYTREEIENEVWQNNGPDERDVPADVDAAFEQEQVVPDSSTGEDGTAEQNIPDQTVTPEDGVQEGVTP